jgi:hypothetical protein
VGPSDSGRGLCLAPRGPVKLCGCGVRVLAGGPSAGWVLGYPSSFLVILMALVGHHSFMGPGPPDDMTEGQFLMSCLGISCFLGAKQGGCQRVYPAKGC